MNTETMGYGPAPVTRNADGVRRFGEGDPWRLLAMVAIYAALALGIMAADAFHEPLPGAGAPRLTQEATTLN